MTIKLKTTTYCIFPPPLILLLCRFNNSLHIARGNFYLPQSLRSRRRNDKKSVKTEKYRFKFTESCMGELGTDKLPEIALLRNKSKSK